MVPALVAASILLAAVLVPHLVVRRHRTRIVLAEAAPRAEWAVILGAPTPPDGPTPVLEDRLATGVALWKAGKVRRLLLTGDDGRRRCDEVAVMRRYVARAQVPDSAVTVDGGGVTTWHSLDRASRDFGVTDAVLVTQDFHLARSLYLASAVGIRAHGVAADRRRYRDLGDWKRRELTAVVAAWARVAWRRNGTR